MCTRKALPDNILDHNFIRNKPRKHFLIYVAYIPYYEGRKWNWSHLSLVLDLNNRKIMAWKSSKTQDIQLALDTLMNLSFTNPAEGAMLHSAHSSIYTAKVFGDTLQRRGSPRIFHVSPFATTTLPWSVSTLRSRLSALRNTSFLDNDQTSFIEQNKMFSRSIDF